MQPRRGLGVACGEIVTTTHLVLQVRKLEIGAPRLHWSKHLKGWSRTGRNLQLTE